MEEPTIESLQAQLEEKEQAAKLAAEIGQQLLEKNQELEATVEDLLKQLQQKEVDLEEKQNAQTALRLQVSDLEHQLQDAAENANRKEDVEELQQNFESLSAKNELLKQQLEHAEITNRELLHEIKQKDEHLRQFSGIEKELSELKVKTRELSDRNEELENDLQAEGTQNQELRTALENEKKRFQDAEKEFQHIRLSEMNNEKKATSDLKSDVENQLRAKLRKQQELLEDTKHSLEDLKWEKKQLEEAVASLVKDNQQLYREKEEHQRFLEEARSTVASLKQSQEEQNLAANQSSLLSEFEQQLNKQSKQYEEVAVSSRRNNETTPKALDRSMAPDSKNCEEYFHLAATAIKIGMAIKYPHVSDAVFKIRSKALWEAAVAVDVPFHEWHDWLVATLTRKLKPTSSPHRMAVRGKRQTPKPKPKKSPEKKGFFSSLFGDSATESGSGSSGIVGWTNNFAKK